MAIIKRSNIFTGVGIALILLGPFAFETIKDPTIIWGLEADDTCEEWNTASIENQVHFLMGCGCLTRELADKIMFSDLMKDRLNDCFDEAMKSCRSWEKIGPIYRSCAEKVAGTVSFK